MFVFFFSSRRRHTRCSRDWSSDVCSSDLNTETLSPISIFFRSAGTTRKQFAVANAAIYPDPCHLNTLTSGTVPRSEERRVGKSVDLGGRRIIKKKKRREQSSCSNHTI